MPKLGSLKNTPSAQLKNLMKVWGSIKEISAKLDRKYSTVCHWFHVGKIPPKELPNIIKCSKGRLSYEDLI